ncbi:hypothetical protein MPSEU_000424200 [Mayamaea pseudoterrestris]|nr:hypothetical protein MPSEU_000424200 [Mayamaea pseudoterrestris]
MANIIGAKDRVNLAKVSSTPSLFRDLQQPRFNTVFLILHALLALKYFPGCSGFASRQSWHCIDRMSVVPGIFARPTTCDQIDRNAGDCHDREWMPVVQDFRETTMYLSEYDEHDKEGEAIIADETCHVHVQQLTHECEFNLSDHAMTTRHIVNRDSRAMTLMHCSIRSASRQLSRPASVTEGRHENAARRTLDTLCSKARGSLNAAMKQQKEVDDTNEKINVVNVTNLDIRETVASMIRSQSKSSLLSVGKRMGLFGEPLVDTILETKLRPADADIQDVVVRIASPRDDMDIASLRLSVFSTFPQDVQSQFRSRSCQAIYNRRLRGAVCVVATLKDSVIGGAECSFDEFRGTQLGRRRLPSKVLYITEVAVNPLVRRQGVGIKLLKAIDKISEANGVESLYLHVEVNNGAAISLYKKAGYRSVGDDPMYLEFTTSLNLHPEATRGRKHHLLYKHLHEPTWAPDTLAATLPVPEDTPPVSCCLGYEDGYVITI